MEHNQDRIISVNETVQKSVSRLLIKIKVIILNMEKKLDISMIGYSADH